MSPILREKATQALELANGVLLPAKFRLVAYDQPAVFQLVFKENEPDKGRAATALFPSDPATARQLSIYRRCFEPDLVDCIYHIFLHELGHILGFRHEFALEREQTNPALRLGNPNAWSVMNYFHDWKKCLLLDQDKVEARLFYEKSLRRYGGKPVIEVSPASGEVAVSSSVGEIPNSTGASRPQSCQNPEQHRKRKNRSRPGRRSRMRRCQGTKPRRLGGLSEI